MFSYYGSKSKIVNKYPKPKYGAIIEPFAGSARYSLRYFENDITLYDPSSYVFLVWKYLIEASEKDVLSLPDMKRGESLDDHTQLSLAEKYLIGFHLSRGKAKPRKRGFGQLSWNRDKFRIASNLYKIRHWIIYNQMYHLAQNTEATWFIDPPYWSVANRENHSEKYPFNCVDYGHLSAFCKSRKGLTIVCENSQAKWLPFKFLTFANMNATAKNNLLESEMVWINDC